MFHHGNQWKVAEYQIDAENWFIPMIWPCAEKYAVEFIRHKIKSEYLHSVVNTEMGLCMYAFRFRWVRCDVQNSASYHKIEMII